MVLTKYDIAGDLASNDDDDDDYDYQTIEVTTQRRLNFSGVRSKITNTTSSNTTSSKSKFTNQKNYNTEEPGSSCKRTQSNLYFSKVLSAAKLMTK